MLSAPRVLLALTLLVLTNRLLAADVASNAIRDAKKLGECMKALNAACANAMTYTKVFEDHGMSRDQLNEAVTTLYGQIKSVHGAFSRFELGAPWPSFVVRGRTYMFLPYSAQIRSPERTVATESFFIGVSEDQGSSWKFVDGQRATPENIGMIIPGYGGGPMPPQRMTQIPSQ
jgi:hypothetical protein